MSTHSNRAGVRPDAQPEVLQIPLSSGLFTFTQDQIFDYEYQGFQLLNVFRKITPEQQKECVDMWLQSGVIESEQQAWQRSEQVCYMFIDKVSGQLAGVNTLYIDVMNGKKWFFNRMFIRPAFRKTRLMILGTSLMLVFSKLHLSDEGVAGVVNVNENNKLHQKSLHKVFTRLGYQFSHEVDNKEIWIFDFDRVEFLNKDRQ